MVALIQLGGFGMYNPVTEEILNVLRQLVGEENVLCDAEAIERYSHDETVGVSAVPEVVVKASNTKQVAQIFFE